MKEASGELNMTVVVILSVAILSAFFFSVIWPMIDDNFHREADCKSATCNCSKAMRDANDGKCCCWRGDNEDIGSCSPNNNDQFLCPFGG